MLHRKDYQTSCTLLLGRVLQWLLMLVQKTHLAVKKIHLHLQLWYQPNPLIYLNLTIVKHFIYDYSATLNVSSFNGQQNLLWIILLKHFKKKIIFLWDGSRELLDLFYMSREEQAHSASNFASRVEESVIMVQKGSPPHEKPKHEKEILKEDF